MDLLRHGYHEKLHDSRVAVDVVPLQIYSYNITHKQEYSVLFDQTNPLTYPGVSYQRAIGKFHQTIVDKQALGIPSTQSNT